MRRELLPIRQPAEHCMVMPAIRRRWTTADVRALMSESRAWPRYELIDGELVVTPAPGSLHQILVLELAIALEEYLRDERIGVAVISPADLELRAGTITQPDVFVIPVATQMAGDRIEWRDVRSLLLAVEVLSASSVRTDRVQKRDFYLENGVEEYWIVDADARVVERWTPRQERPTIDRSALTWAPANARALVLDLSSLFERAEAKARLFRR
jgi:Uma2 family endonuclease